MKTKKKVLKKWVKVALTITVLFIGLVIYSYAGILGEMAQTSKWYLALCIFAWCWLFAGQFLLIELIWEEK